MGIGAFSLLVSMLPATVLRLLPVHRLLWRSPVRPGTAGSGCRRDRQPASTAGPAVAGSYYANQAQVMARQDCQSAERWAARLQRAATPTVQCWLYLQGRIGVLQVPPPAGADWLQLRLLCDWEMMWVACLPGGLAGALVRAERLAGGSNWSKAQQWPTSGGLLPLHARCTGTVSGKRKREAEAASGNRNRNRKPEPEPEAEPEVQSELEPEMRRKKDDNLLMQQLQSMFEQRAEAVPAPRRPHAAAATKFAARRSQRWLEQSGRLILPGLELLIVWGVCHLIEPTASPAGFYLRCRPSQTVWMSSSGSGSCSRKGANGILTRKMTELLCLLLKAILLAASGKRWAFQAEQCLLEVTDTLSGRVHRTVTRSPDGAAEARRAYSPVWVRARSAWRPRIHMKAHAMAQELADLLMLEETLVQRRGPNANAVSHEAGGAHQPVGHPVRPRRPHHEAPAVAEGAEKRGRDAGSAETGHRVLLPQEGVRHSSGRRLQRFRGLTKAESALKFSLGLLRAGPRQGFARPKISPGAASAERSRSTSTKTQRHRLRSPSVNNRLSIRPLSLTNFLTIGSRFVSYSFLISSLHRFKISTMDSIRIDQVCSSRVLTSFLLVLQHPALLRDHHGHDGQLAACCRTTVRAIASRKVSEPRQSLPSVELIASSSRLLADALSVPDIDRQIASSSCDSEEIICRRRVSSWARSAGGRPMELSSIRLPAIASKQERSNFLLQTKSMRLLMLLTASRCSWSSFVRDSSSRYDKAIEDEELEPGMELRSNSFRTVEREGELPVGPGDLDDVAEQLRILANCRSNQW
uniref:G_PROTEIN_RECEP_F1_2 domain-containing protein n=1 Tax=Macrostomum lignano TaxID=282301 RepID=A0A1I8FLY9_9PLAT